MSLPEDVRGAIVGSYYPRAVGAPDAARSRAQAGYAIASALAASLIAAGAFGNVQRRPPVVQVLGLAALLLWLAAALLFIWAVAAPVKEVVEGDQQSAGDFANAVLKNARTERQEVDSRQGWARRASALAGVLTLGAFIAALLLPAPSGSPSIAIRWSRAGTKAKLTVKVEVTQLAKGSTVEVTVLGMRSAAREVLLFRSVSVAGASGKLEIAPELTLNSDYRSFKVTAAVRRGAAILHNSEATVQPDG